MQESQRLAAGWTQCCYVLPSSLPDFAHLTVRSIEVACNTTGSSAGTAVPLLAYLGKSLQPWALQLMTDSMRSYDGSCSLPMLASIFAS